MSDEPAHEAWVVEKAEEYLDQLRVELAPGTPAQLIEGPVMASRRLVGAGGRLDPTW